jgi:hypothetical protein
MSKSLHESNQKIELTEQKLTETTVEKDQLIKLLQDELKQLQLSHKDQLTTKEDYIKKHI